MRSKKSIEEEHFHSHTPNFSFDYYCVAHNLDYEPKYLQELGEICHDTSWDSECSPSCRICPIPCPFTPCPIPYDD